MHLSRAALPSCCKHPLTKMPPATVPQTTPSHPCPLSFRYAPSLPFGLLGVLRFSTCSTALQLSDTPRHLVRLFGFVSVVLRALFTCLFIDLFCEFRQFFVGGLFLFKSLFQQRSVI